jgi:hypothetical protein
MRRNTGASYPTQLASKEVPLRLPQDFFEALVPCVPKLLRPQDLEETEHFRRWR